MNKYVVLCLMTVVGARNLTVESANNYTRDMDLISVNPKLVSDDLVVKAASVEDVKLEASLDLPTLDQDQVLEGLSALFEESKEDVAAKISDDFLASDQDQTLGDVLEMFENTEYQLNKEGKLELLNEFVKDQIAKTGESEVSDLDQVSDLAQSVSKMLLNDAAAENLSESRWSDLLKFLHSLITSDKQNVVYKYNAKDVILDLPMTLAFFDEYLPNFDQGFFGLSRNEAANYGVTGYQMIKKQNGINIDFIVRSLK